MTDGAIQPEGLPVPTSPYSPVVAADVQESPGSVKAQGAVTVTATVKSVDQQSRVVTLVGSDGQETTFRGFVGSRPPAHRTGDIVKVLYDPANPARAMVDSMMVVWLLPTIFVANAVPWLLAAVVLLALW